MEQFNIFLAQGFFHILDLQGYDHILFLFVIFAIYSEKDWKQLLWIITSFTIAHSLKEIASLLNCEFVGDENFEVLGMNEIHVVEKGDIVFVDHPKYYDKALNSAATIVLINKRVDCPKGKALLISEDPFRDFNKLTQHFKPFQFSGVAISSSAII